jgi:deoxyribose-phosphate aldolase
VTTGPNIDLLADLIAAELRAQLTSGTSSVLGACDRCDGAHCVTHCADKVQRLAACGADRFTAGPGIDACDNVLARMIDHTLLAPTASQDEIEALCDEAVEFCFATVCINPWWVRLAAERLATTPVRVCTVIGFPLGANRSETKAYEAIRALEDGASELDMVINVGALRSGAYSEVERDIRSVVEAARRRAKVKVIIEAAHLNDEEKVKACVLAQEADIRLMRRAVGGELGVKAAGGVGDQPTALKMIKAGATRIGASAGVKIVRGNGAGPERPYGATAAEPSSSGNGDIRATVIPAPRATIHKLG